MFPGPRTPGFRPGGGRGGAPRARRVARGQLPVERAEGREVLLHGEEFESARPRRLTQARTALRVAQQREARVGERRGVARRDHQSGAADDFDHRAHVRGDGGPAAEHRLHQADREALDDAGQDHHPAGRVRPGELLRPGPADLLEADRALHGPGLLRAGRVPGPVSSPAPVSASGSLSGGPGEEHVGQGPAVREVRGALGTFDRGTEDPQPGTGFGPVHLGEGVQQGDEVLGGLDPAHPHQGVRAGAVPLAHLREAPSPCPGTPCAASRCPPRSVAASGVRGCCPG